jgi:hypothetical protein
MKLHQHTKLRIIWPKVLCPWFTKLMSFKAFNHFLSPMINMQLIQTPPFCNCIFNYCSTINIVETTKTVANYFLQLGNVFLNYKPTKSISTSRECHYNWKCLPRVNTISIATTYHFSRKMFYQSSWGMLSTTLTWWMNFIR